MAETNEVATMFWGKKPATPISLITFRSFIESVSFAANTGTERFAHEWNGSGNRRDHLTQAKRSFCGSQERGAVVSGGGLQGAWIFTFCRDFNMRERLDVGSSLPMQASPLLGSDHPDSVGGGSE